MPSTWGPGTRCLLPPIRLHRYRIASPEQPADRTVRGTPVAGVRIDALPKGTSSTNDTVTQHARASGHSTRAPWQSRPRAPGRGRRARPRLSDTVGAVAAKRARSWVTQAPWIPNARPGRRFDPLALKETHAAGDAPASKNARRHRRRMTNVCRRAFAVLGLRSYGLQRGERPVLRSGERAAYGSTLAGVVRAR